MRITVVAAACLTAAALWALPAQARLSDEQVKARMIEASIAEYSGNCPCPYNTMRNGRSCGGRSAWSRAGGESPLCYKKEITPAMVKAWREANGE